MKKILILVLFALICLNSKLFAYGIGYSSFPLEEGKRMVSTEMTGITSTGGGVGLQGRFVQKISDKWGMDAGVGIGSGERTRRIFVGSDFEIFPDYMRQPRFSLKTSFENAKEFDSTQNILSVAPTVSKGFSFWGDEAFPYLALPVGLSLNSDKKSYETVITAHLGVSGNLPIEGYSKFTGLVEGIVGLKNSYSGVFLGVSYPLN